MMNNTEAMTLNELGTETLEEAAGGTPMSIPGGKRSGRKNSETALEIINRLEDWGNGILESLGLKEKPVNNSIYDRRVTDQY